MIAVDLDGTLLNSQAAISPRNLAALYAAAAAGIHIAFATGRRHAYAMRVLRTIESSIGSTRSSAPTAL